MLTLDYIRENRQKVIDAAKNKNREVDVDKLLSLDEKRRELIQHVQKLREERNVIAKQKPDPQMIERGKKLKEDIKTIGIDLSKAEDELNKILLTVPNIPLDHVQSGDESQNKILRKEGEVKPQSFTPKDHTELGKFLDIIDIERAAKVSGSRFAYLKNEGALLEIALVQYAMKKLVSEGFSPIIPPVLIKQQVTVGLGYWEGNHNNYYLVEDYEEDDKPNPLYLVGTGEHSVVPMYKDEILNGSELPKRVAAFSSCFRREAGAAGKDTKGILRVHQFEKVEMISFCTPDQDENERKKMLSIAESILRELELPYQVVQLATGDLSGPAAETIDLETWIPTQNKYRETNSISTTTDFQARRFKIRYKNNPSEPTNHVHILNGTALALGRIIIAILENYQQADGSVKIPAVLHQYTGFTEIKSKV